MESTRSVAPRWRAVVVGVILASLGAALAAPPAGIEVQNAWVRWLPPGVPNTALYGEIVNRSDREVRLVGGSSPVAEACAPMRTVRKDTGSPSGPEVAMETVPFLSVPAHGTLVLRPGGNHLMIMGLHPDWSADGTLDLTLHFGAAGDLSLNVAVAHR